MERLCVTKGSPPSQPFTLQPPLTPTIRIGLGGWTRMKEGKEDSNASSNHTSAISPLTCFCIAPFHADYLTVLDQSSCTCNVPDVREIDYLDLTILTGNFRG